MVAAIAPHPGETFVEIGPGTGALTRPLLEKAGELDAIELDRDLAERLARTLDASGSLRIHRQDALTTDFLSFRRGDRPLRIVGNLPYNISTPLLFHVTQWGTIADMHFLLQKEVVERMAAGPGGRTYGRLSVMLQYRCRIEPLFDVPPGAFRPPPRVTSTFVRLVPHGEPPVPVRDPAALAAVVGQAFSQRRKTLRNALRPLLSAESMCALGIDPGARPETLDLAAFARLANVVSATPGMG